jgi:hypothetical protein
MVRIARIGSAALAVMACLASIAACGGDESTGLPAGTSTAAHGGPESTGVSPTTSETSSGNEGDQSGADELLELDPCALFSATQIEAAGIERLPETQGMSSDSSRMCTWGESYATQGLEVRLKEGDPELAQPRGSTPGTESMVDGREARRFTESTTNSVCTSVIVVSTRSYVLVQLSGQDSITQVCAKLDQLLPVVSAKLPR